VRVAVVITVLLIAVWMSSALVMADEPLTLENRAFALEALHGLYRSTPTAEESSTATGVPPTATATNTLEPTATNEPQGCTVPDGADVWHVPTDHEHGDVPPQWANDWSCAQFGHHVIYGGDEQTPDENLYRHKAFKGYGWTTTADNDVPVDLYLRLHMQTNPLGRAGRYHSYELYAGINGDVVGFWQGWLDFGPSPDARDSFADDHLWVIIPQHNPANHIVGFDPASNPYYEPSYSGREFWYSQLATDGGWESVIIVDVYDPTTYYSDGESTDSQTWQTTGDYGLDRRVTLRWIAGGSTAVTISGQPYLNRNMDDPRGWFCATPTGTIASAGLEVCAAGSLPQYIAQAMPVIGDTSQRTQYHNQWACPTCSLPN
jgi:hypothetical protein